MTQPPIRYTTIFDPKRAPRIWSAWQHLANKLTTAGELTWSAAVAEMLAGSDITRKTCSNVLKAAQRQGLVAISGRYWRGHDTRIVRLTPPSHAQVDGHP